MKTEHYILFAIVLAIAAAVLADRYYVSKFEGRFLALEKQRIVTSNKLATAKIVYENLNHVRDLVFKNMDFPGQTDTITNETYFFDFMTTCVNDLKLKLVAVKPLRPVVQDRVTIYGYDIEIEGDFFKFGELCSKLENSRRLASIETFGVSLLSERERPGGGAYKGVKIAMRVNTYRVKKMPEPIAPVAAAGAGAIQPVR
jgi:hypothetical protein